MNIREVLSRVPDEAVPVIDTDNYKLKVTHYSESLNNLMVRDSESGQWFSYDEEQGYLYDELAQEDMRLLTDIQKILEQRNLLHRYNDLINSDFIQMKGSSLHLDTYKSLND